jgi:MerR family transcriptional regulator, light-induced transcriptional regulator
MTTGDPTDRSVMSVRSFTAGLLRSSSRSYAQAVLRQMRELRADLADHGLPTGFASALDDTEVRLLHLAASVAVDRPALMAHALAWYKVAFGHREVPAEYLPLHLTAMQRALRAELPPATHELVERHLLAGQQALREAPLELPMVLGKSAPHGELAMQFLLAVLEGRGDDAVDRVRAALAAGASIADIHDHVLVPVQREAGRMWLMGEIPIADEHYGSGVVDRVLWLLHERIARPPTGAAKVLTMGVGGNLHDFGLRLVAQRLQLAGFAVHHLGASMPANDMQWALQDRGYQLIAISATLALHVPALIELVAQVRAAQQRLGQHTPILVGGELFRIVPDLHSLVGADAAATDAAFAVTTAQRLVSASRAV